MPASVSFAGPAGPRPRRSGIAFRLRSNSVAYHEPERLSRALPKPWRPEQHRIRPDERRPAKQTLRFDRHPRENALRSARRNLSLPSPDRKDADLEGRSPRGLRNFIFVHLGYTKESLYKLVRRFKFMEFCQLWVDKSGMDRVGMPSDPRANLIAPSRDRKDADHKSGGPRYLLSTTCSQPS